MGYYKISFLETQKVDLTNYATTSALSTALTTKIGNNTDTYTGTAAAQYIITLTQAEYDAIGTKNANTLYVII